MLSKIFKLSEAIAGATLLAFGNCAPDLFTAIGNSKSDTEMMFAQMMGSATFIVGVISGLILFIHPIQLSPISVLRDIFFFGGGIIWIGKSIIDEEYTYFECAITMSFYFLYLLIIISQFLYLKFCVKDEERGLLSSKD